MVAYLQKEMAQLKDELRESRDSVKEVVQHGFHAQIAAHALMRLLPMPPQARRQAQVDCDVLRDEHKARLDALQADLDAARKQARGLHPECGGATHSLVHTRG